MEMMICNKLAVCDFYCGLGHDKKHKFDSSCGFPCPKTQGAVCIPVPEDNSVLEQGMVDKQKEIEALKAQIHFLNKQLENQDTYIYKIKNSIART